ncbi:MAG: hypothetical protein EZS28_027472, partial [Streblomastix strix]
DNNRNRKKNKKEINSVQKAKTVRMIRQKPYAEKHDVRSKMKTEVVREMIVKRNRWKEKRKKNVREIKRQIKNWVQKKMGCQVISCTMMMMMMRL